jgi:hypothetical protein
MTMRPRSGTSLIDLVISIGILAILFGGIYLVYFSIITAITSINVRSDATEAIGQEIEMIRNLPYGSVGTVGGVPSGVLPQIQTMTVGNYTFTLQTTIRNIDDPFDGTLGGNPNDTAPDDYKLVQVDATCPLCDATLDVAITTTVAPKNLESATQNGSLFLYAIDANGNPLSGVTMHVIDASVTPTIDLTDTTNVSGVLQLVGVPTSTRSYSVIASEAGYSSDRTYPPGAVGNPNPVEPYLTVAAQTVTAATFSIDRLSQLSVITSDEQCKPLGNEQFSMQGGKLIGTNPNVFKFSTSSITSASGTVNFPQLEWDTYTLTPSDIGKDLMGTIPLAPITINPSSTITFRMILQAAANPALLVTTADSASGNVITNATVSLSKSGFSSTLITGRAVLSQTDWSGQGTSGYSSQSGGIDPNSVPGQLTLLADDSGMYATGTIESLISNTFDLGGTSSTLFSLSWNPTSEPPAVGPNSVQFQVAANNDNATWNFIGPDGTANTYFTSSSSSIPLSLSGNRYFRYQVYLSTQDPNTTPQLTGVSLNFSADCVPPAQVLFTNLTAGNYTLDVQAPGYAEVSSTIPISSGFQSSTIRMAQ